jgi:hypothetical protein
MYTPTSTPLDRKTNFILKNSELYGASAAFRAMVDSTVYFSAQERHESAAYLTEHYGASYEIDRALDGLDAS